METQDERKTFAKDLPSNTEIASQKFIAKKLNVIRDHFFWQGFSNGLSWGLFLASGITIIVCLSVTLWSGFHAH